MARILDFTDGFTSSTEPTAIPFPSAVIPSTENGIARYADTSGNLEDSQVLIDDNNNVEFPATISTQKQDVVSNATINQLDTSKTFIRFTGGVASEVRGALAGRDGQILTVHNSASETVTFKHQDGNALDADRFKFTEAEDIELDPDSSIEFIYDITQERWVIKSGSGTLKLVGFQEVPTGLINGANTVFTISAIPLTEDSLIVYLDYIVLDKSLWSLSGQTLTLTNAPAVAQNLYVTYLSKGSPVSGPAGGIEPFVEYPTITAGDIIAKEITLTHTPTNPLLVMVDVIGGSTQIYGEDYSVSGNILSWDTLGMEVFIANGNRLRIFYFY